MERINEGRRVVFLPGPVSHVKGSISQSRRGSSRPWKPCISPPYRSMPVFTRTPCWMRRPIRTPRRTSRYIFSPKLAPGAEMAARLTSAWLECSAQAYATLPQLHGSLSALLSAASNFIPIAGSSTALTTLLLTYGQLLAISVAFAKRLKNYLEPPGRHHSSAGQGSGHSQSGCLFAGKTPVNSIIPPRKEPLPAL